MTNASMNANYDDIRRQYSQLQSGGLLGEDLNKALYNYAKGKGYSGSTIDNAFGAAVGTTNTWARNNSLGELNGLLVPGNSGNGHVNLPNATTNPSVTLGNGYENLPNRGTSTTTQNKITGYEAIPNTSTPTTPQPIDNGGVQITNGMTPEQWMALINKINTPTYTPPEPETPTENTGLIDALTTSMDDFSTRLSDAITNNKAVTREITPQETASYQLQQMLNSGSPLMQQAQRSGEAYANDRGLLYSSIAANAAQDAMIQNAAPIAQFDAGQYSVQGLANQQAQNQFGLARLNNEFDRYSKDADRALKVWGQQDQQTFDAGESARDRAFDARENALTRNLDLARIGLQHDLTMDRDAALHGYDLDKVDFEYGKRFEEIDKRLGADMTMEELQQTGRMDLQSLRNKATQMGLDASAYSGYVTAHLGALTAQRAEEYQIQNKEGVSDEQKQEAIEEVTERYSQSFQYIDQLYAEVMNWWDWRSLMPQQEAA